MTKFYNATGHLSVTAAVVAANGLLAPRTSLMMSVGMRNDWEYDAGTGLEVVQKLLVERPPLSVFFYRPKWPWSKAVGYYDGEAVHINRNRFAALCLEDVVGLLLHEYAHHCGFHHGNNYKTAHKVKYSVPYYLSENVGRWI